MKNVIALLLVLCMACSSITVTYGKDGAMMAEALKCEYMKTPSGIDVTPHFSWILKAKEEGRAQSAYEIVVSDKKTLVWDSGKVISTKQNQIAYEGAPLQSKTRYYWCVKVWDDNGAESDFSEKTYFDTGVFNEEQWSAKWIKAVPAYPNADIRFKKTRARYIRLNATTLGEMVVGENGYRLQMAEMEIYSGKENVALGKAVSSNDAFTNATWSNACLTDAKLDSAAPNQGFTSNLHNTQSANVWVTVDLGSEREIDRVVLYPRNDAQSQSPPTVANFATSYTLEASLNNTDFDTLYAVSDAAAPCFYDKALPIAAKSFEVEKEVESAFAYASAPGMFELNINGEKASDAFFEPGETNYDKKVFYSTYDITDKIKIGTNTAGAYLGKGFYCNPSAGNRYNRSPKIWGDTVFFCEIQINYQDGTKDIIGTNDTWKVTQGPITESVWLGGEDYDARLEKDFADNDAWDCATEAQSLSFERMEGKKYASLKEMQRLKAVSVTKIADKKYVVDFGVNSAGVFNFTASAPRDTKAVFYPAENINADGSVNQGSTIMWGASGKIFDTYTFKGEGVECYTPKFVYHGMRYLQVEGVDATSDMFTFSVVYCANERAGMLETSDEAINKTLTIIKRSVASNMYNVLTDCPHREKLGWLEVPSLLYNTLADLFDISSYMTKISNDIIDAQKQSGSVPSIVPPLTVGIAEHALRQGEDDTPNDPNWCGSVILIPWRTYERYHNKAQLETAFEPMVKYYSYLRSLAEKSGEKYILESSALNRDLGDWVYRDYTDTTFVVSCTYYQLTKTMADICAVLDYDGSEYSALAENIKSAINNKFLHKTYYCSNTQTANALPLYLGIVPEDAKAAVVKSMAESVKVANYHITTGEVGMYPLLAMLSEYGYSDAAYKIITAEGEGGYKYFLELGKTSLPEVWSGGASQNHCILGHGAAWLYEYLLGIRIDSEKIIIEPYIPKELRFAEGNLETPWGKAEVSWEKSGGDIVMDVTVPFNTTAIIRVGDKTYEKGGGSYHFVFPRDEKDCDIEITDCRVSRSADGAKGSFDVNNFSGERVKVNAFAALYDEDDRLQSLSNTNISIDKSGTYDFNIASEEIYENKKLKVMAWSDKMRPVCKAWDFRVESSATTLAEKGDDGYEK